MDNYVLDGPAVPRDTTRDECVTYFPSAFFRGVYAVIRFDVKQHMTLCALRPLSDGDGDDGEMEKCCLVVVGNDTDLVSSSIGSVIFRRGCLKLLTLSGSRS